MAEIDTASIHHLHQPRPKTAAERARAYRERQKAKADQNLPAVIAEISSPGEQFAPIVPEQKTFRGTGAVRERDAAPILLILAAMALGATGITMNGYFARSLGATDIAGYLFLAVGVAADIAALALPACAARHWQAGHPGTAGVAWLVWCATFMFAITAGIGFASVNISDVTMARSSRSTPAVTNAQTAVSDAMAARDRECIHGVGKFCREREAAVVDLRAILNRELAGVASVADPQSQAAIRMVAWASRGAVQPTTDDFAMLRLALLALLPQIGGILLMVGRR